MIDKKRLKKSLIIISLIIIIIFATIQIRNTLARYETVTTGQVDVEAAFWIVESNFESKTIIIDDIYPSEESFKYTFAVSNFNDTRSAETDLDYEILLTSTTNLPLSYEIVKVIKEGEIETEKPCIVEEELYQDTDNTVFRKFRLETEANALKMAHENDITDTFRIKVTFPQENSTTPEYADLIESIKLDLTAKQVIDK